MHNIKYKGRIIDQKRMRSLAPSHYGIINICKNNTELWLDDYYNEKDKYFVIGPSDCGIVGCFVYRDEIKLSRKTVIIITRNK